MMGVKILDVNLLVSDPLMLNNIGSKTAQK